jgi:hypothetical protein
MNDDVKKAVRRTFCAKSMTQVHPQQAGQAMKSLKTVTEKPA